MLPLSLAVRRSAYDDGLALDGVDIAVTSGLFHPGVQEGERESATIIRQHHRPLSSIVIYASRIGNTGPSSQFGLADRASTYLCLPAQHQLFRLLLNLTSAVVNQEQ